MASWPAFFRTTFSRVVIVASRVRGGVGAVGSIVNYPILPVCWYFHDLKLFVLVEVPDGAKFGDRGNP